MPVITTLDVIGLTTEEYRRVLDYVGVEIRPAAGIYLHLAMPITGGSRG
jgi:hypothetical protein